MINEKVVVMLIGGLLVFSVNFHNTVYCMCIKEPSLVSILYCEEVCSQPFLTVYTEILNRECIYGCDLCKQVGM